MSDSHIDNLKDGQFQPVPGKAQAQSLPGYIAA